MMHFTRTVHVRGQRWPQDTPGCVTSTGRWPRALCSLGSVPPSPRGAVAALPPLPPFRGSVPARAAAGGMPKALQELWWVQHPRLSGPTLPVPRHPPRRRERTTQKLPRKENPGTSTPTQRRSGPTRTPRTPGRGQGPCGPGHTPLTSPHLPSPHRAGPGRAGSAAPLPGAPRSPALSARRLRALRGRTRPARAAAALLCCSLLLQTSPASPRSRAVPRRAAAGCLISPSAPPLASQMVSERGHGGGRGNALILLLGYVLTSWWSCLKVRKAAETRNLA